MIRLVVELPAVDAWEEGAAAELLAAAALAVAGVAGMRDSTGCDLTGVRPVFTPWNGHDSAGTWRIDIG